MLIAIVGLKLFLIVTRGVRRYAYSFTWSEILCPLLYLVCDVVLGMNRYAHCYTWSEVICALLNME